MFEGENEFSVGDRVKFKKSSLETSMIDAKEDDVFIIENFQDKAKTLVLLEGKYFAIYNVEHLEHVKEQTMNNAEGQEIKWEGSQINWEVGQVVWCLVYGKGVVDTIFEESIYPVCVYFDADVSYKTYTIEGKLYKGANRTLFFSEPKVIAESFPPKKAFVPTLKKGENVYVVYNQGKISGMFGVVKELEDCVVLADYSCEIQLEKSLTTIRKLGEEIKFN